MVVESDGLDVKINYERVIEREPTLRYFKGWIPSNLLLHIELYSHDNIQGRYDFLKENGIYDEVYKKDLEYRQQLKSYETYEEKEQFKVETMVKWVEDNPQFEDLLSGTVHDLSDVVMDDSDHKLPTFDISKELD